MLLHCTFEELTALSAGAGRVLADSDAGGSAAVAAPPEIVAELEAIAPRFNMDITLSTLAEQALFERAVRLLVEDLRYRLDLAIIEHHPAAEESVASYFDFAHVLAVHARLRRVGAEMAAVIELVTGHAPTEDSARSFNFPD